MEKSYNKFYEVLASKLCSYNYNFKFSFQYAIWDKFKSLSEMQVLAISHLAKFVAGLILEFSLPISVLKVVNFASLDTHMILFLRVFFLAVFEVTDSDKVQSVFERLLAAETSPDLVHGISMFIESTIAPLLQQASDRIKDIQVTKRNLKVAKKQLGKALYIDDDM
tara:strand:- start:778 stop:1275 length:498 start_codon:yes stop_codon:yes gene_type:complete